MSILIEKPDIQFPPPRGPAWVWLVSAALHGALLLALLGLASADGLPPIMRISLLAPPPLLAEAEKPTQPPRPAPPIHQPLSRPARPQPAAAAPSPPAAPPEKEERPAPLVSSGPYEAGQLDSQPRLLVSVDPVYPQAARRRGIEGWVEIKFLVNRQGRVSREMVLQAHPDGIFEKSALNALRGWQFAPATLQGRMVDAWMVQVVRFRLINPG